VGSGSGWVAVVQLDRRDQGGSNGTGLNVIVAVLREIRQFRKDTEKCVKKCEKMEVQTMKSGGGVGSGSGRVGVVPLDRVDQGGSNGIG
jgi:hypothetical protein